MTLTLIKQEHPLLLQNATTQFEDQTIIEAARKIFLTQKSDLSMFVSVSDSLQQIMEYCGRTDSCD
jgi:hypothetical protein